MRKTKRWALLDTKDNVLMGDSNGPATYDEYDEARLAAMVTDVRLGQYAGRTRAIPYTGDPRILRDEVATKMTTRQALELLEDGKA